MIHASAEFSHPASTVFAAVSDVAAHAAWQSGIESIEVTGGDGRSAGSRFRVRVVESGIELDFEGEVVEAVEPSRLRHVLKNDDAQLDVTVSIADVDSGARSRLDYRAEISIKSFALKMLRGMIESKLGEKAQKDMESLARHLDARD